MTTWTEKEIRMILSVVMGEVKGKAVSDADRAYKRGWRDCIRSIRDQLALPTARQMRHRAKP